MVTSYCRPEVEIWPFRVCTMHPTIIIGTVQSFRTWPWGRYHVPQNVLLVIIIKQFLPLSFSTHGYMIDTIKQHLCSFTEV